MNYRNNMSRTYDYRSIDDSAECNCKKCGKVNIPDGVISLAMVYTVSQCWRNVSDCEKGFSRGTIFDELHKPFAGDKCKCGGLR